MRMHGLSTATTGFAKVENAKAQWHQSSYCIETNAMRTISADRGSCDESILVLSLHHCCRAHPILLLVDNRPYLFGIESAFTGIGLNEDSTMDAEEYVVEK